MFHSNKLHGFRGVTAKRTDYRQTTDFFRGVFLWLGTDEKGRRLMYRPIAYLTLVN